MILLGDCLERLKELEDNSIDSVVTDPPYGLAFMGKKWDYDVPSIAIWSEVIRVLKPGGHLLSFGGTRTYHRMVCAIEDAGFEIKDQLQWNFGSGFPKSLNIRKSAIKQGIACACENSDEKERNSDGSAMRNLQSDVGAEDALSGRTEQNLFAEMSEFDAVAIEERQVSNKPIDLSGVQKRISSKVSSRQKPSEQDLLLQVPGHSEVEPTGNMVAPSLDSLEYEGPQGSSIIRTKQPKLARRGDIQAEQGQLHRPEVHSMSERVSVNGQKGRLHNGAPSSDGNAFESNVDPNRGGPSQGSQHSEQLHNEFGVIPQQSGTQTCRRCGKAIFDPGLGTALKPANEPIVLARKPLSEKTVAANVLKWGVGGLNIDESRIGSEIRTNQPAGSLGNDKTMDGGKANPNKEPTVAQGRWPANLLLGCDCEGAEHEQLCAVHLLDEQSGTLKNGGQNKNKNKNPSGMFGTGASTNFANDSGGASRFFYVAKTSKRERNAGLENEIKQKQGARPNSADATGKFPDHDHRPSGGNNHPTVKPLKLMEYLIKLITPPGGTVLDPFMGSGSTGVAAFRLGFKFIGIEMNEEYLEIAKKRIEAAS